jgi:AraC-like DNA-binding protein
VGWIVAGIFCFLHTLEYAFLAISYNIMSDAFSDLVDLAEARCSISGAVLASGQWAAHLPSPKSLKLFVMKSRCYFALEGGLPIFADRGDFFLVRRGNGYTMSSAIDAPLGGEVTFHRDAQMTSDAYHSSACVALACFVSLEESAGNMLMNVLPNYFVIRACHDSQSTLHLLYDELVNEVRANDIGAKSAVDKLTQIIFLRVLRAYRETASESAGALGGRWPLATQDQRISKSLRLMNDRPEHPWTLQEFADACNMSRTSYASRFRTSVGVTPQAYLRDLRMRRAVVYLTQSARSVANIGNELGYASESAFSTAFKKAMKLSPAHYRANFRREQS